MIEYVPILVMMCFAVLIAGLIVGASHLLGPRISKKTKLSTYECGMQTIGPTRMKINIRYYIIAMLFLIFDIEIMFFYPWAVVTGGLELFGFVEMLIFALILFVGYVYVPGCPPRPEGLLKGLIVFRKSINRGSSPLLALDFCSIHNKQKACHVHLEYPGAWYHVMNRGKRFEKIFADTGWKHF